MSTSFADCSGTPFNYQPEYNTARFRNIVPWAALETNISTEYEIGHFEPCTTVTDPASIGIDTIWQNCVSPYENDTSPDSGNPEVSDAPCFPKGDTHGALDAPPNEVAGCLASDVDFDGTSYRTNWPNKLSAGPFPTPFRQLNPRTNGHSYPLMMFQTDAAASESTCAPDGTGCAVPAPGSPGNFYPYYTQAKVSGQCVWEFGQMRNGRTFGADSPVRRSVAVLLRQPGRASDARGQLLNHGMGAPRQEAPPSATRNHTLTRPAGPDSLSSVSRQTADGNGAGLLDRAAHGAGAGVPAVLPPCPAGERTARAAR